MPSALRVLYVDDEPSLLALGKLFLEESGDFTVTTAISAPEGVRLLEQEKFDAIVSDYQMPGMDGIQFLVEVRERFGPIPFILFTGRGREEVVIQALNSGADFYLQKGGEPISQFAELSHKVRIAIERLTTSEAFKVSETRLRTLIENASDIIRILDRDGLIVFDTSASEHLLGYPPGFMIGKSPMEFIHPDDLGMVKRELSLVYTNTNPDVPTEFRIRRADGSYTWVESVGKNLTGVPGINGIVITTRFIDERKKGEASLRKSEERYRRIVETSREGIWAMDEKFVTTYVNECLIGMLGYSAEEMIGKQIQSFMATEELADHRSQLEQRQAGKSGSYERRFRAKDGSFRIMNVSATPIIGEGGSFQGSFAMLTDITERKRAEEELLRKNEELHASYEEITATEEELRANLNELAWQEQALRKSEASLREILDATPFPVALVDLQDNNIEFWSRSALTIFGHTAPTAPEWYLLAYPDPDYRQDVINRWKPYLEQAKLSGLSVNTGEYRVTCRDGTVRTCDLYATFLADKLVVTFNDITERKVALAALTENEERLRTTLEILPVGVFIFSKNGQILTANAMVNRIWGVNEGVVPYSSDMQEYVEYKGWWPDTGVALRPEDWAASRVLMKGEAAPVDIVNIQRFDGSFGTIIVSAVPIHDDGGSINGAVAVIQDITEIKRAEVVLAESEDRFRGIFDTITSGVAIYEVRNDGASGKDYIIKDFNKTALEIEGKTKEEVVGKSLFDLRPAIDEYGLIPVFQQVWATGVPAYFPQKIYIDEKYSSWYENRVFRLQNGEIVAVYDDVTERKRAEEQLRESEERLRMLSEAAFEGIMIHDKGVIEDSNPRFAEMFGYTPEEIVGRNGFEFMLTSDSLDAISKWRESGFIGSIDVTGIRKDGSLFYGETTSGPVLWQGKQHAIVKMRDITERKLREETHAFLVQCGYPGSGEDFFNSMARYLAEHLNMDYVCIDTLEGDGLTAQTLAVYNDGMFDTNVRYALKDTPCGVVVGKNICCFSDEVCRLFPNDPALQDLGARSYIGTTLWSSEGKPIGLIALIRRKPLHNPELAKALLDMVTMRAAGELERRLGEWALQESEEKYRMYIDHSPEGVFIVDEGGNYTDVNPSACLMLGYSREEFLVRSVRDMVPPDHLSNSLSRFSKLKETGMLMTELLLVKKNGDLLPVILNAVNMPDGKYLGFCTDITERKHAEVAFRMANKKLNLLSGITRHDINNQLLVLNGFLKLLQKKATDPAYEDFFTRIMKASSQISSMIQFTKEYEQIGVNAPAWQGCHTLIETAAMEIQLGEISVVNDFPSGSEVFADPMIVKVFYNLMDNAVRYGEKITTIGFSVEESGDDHLIICEDDGNGVPVDEKEKIFERGFGKNTGMGLFLSQEILSITGITITETGEPGKGARFEMVVPKGIWRN